MPYRREYDTKTGMAHWTGVIAGETFVASVYKLHIAAVKSA